MKAKQKRSGLLTLVLFALAVLLLIGSTIGSSRAALTYFSATYAAEVSMYDIGITLVENDKDVSHRNYVDLQWQDTGKGQLLEHLKYDADGQPVDWVPGKIYDERLTITNSGTIDHYARVTIYRYWQQKTADGRTIRRNDLDPDAIQLHLVDNAGWIEDTEAKTKERTVLYYQYILPAKATAPLFADTIRIDDVGVRRQTSETTYKNELGQTVTKRTYDYNGVEFVLEVTADAVQTHNAEQAIRSAWGVDWKTYGIKPEYQPGIAAPATPAPTPDTATQGG